MNETTLWVLINLCLAAFCIAIVVDNMPERVKEQPRHSVWHVRLEADSGIEWVEGVGYNEREAMENAQAGWGGDLTGFVFTGPWEKLTIWKEDNHR